MSASDTQSSSSVRRSSSSERRIHECLVLRRHLFPKCRISGSELRVQDNNSLSWLSKCKGLELFPSQHQYPVLFETRVEEDGDDHHGSVHRFVAKFMVVPKQAAESKTERRVQTVDIRLNVALAKQVVADENRHIVLPIATQQVSAAKVKRFLWSRFLKNKPANKKRTYEDFKSCLRVEPVATVMFVEYCPFGDIERFARKRLGADKTELWRSILAQICVTLARVQKRIPSFRFNDAHTKNWFVAPTPDREETVELSDTMFIRLPTYGFEVRMFDFEFGCTSTLSNPKTEQPEMKAIGITGKTNHYYDLHTICNDIRNVVKRHDLPTEVARFLCDVVPRKYRIPFNQKRLGRLKATDPILTTPLEVLKKHPLFRPYRHVPVQEEAPSPTHDTAQSESSSRPPTGTVHSEERVATPRPSTDMSDDGRSPASDD